MLIEQIKELPINTKIDGIFAISECQLKSFRQKDGYFLSCRLSDKTGFVDAIIWDNADNVMNFIKSIKIN